MAHAMNMFRKRQKLMLAILGVLCMFGFVVAGTNFYPGSSDDFRDPVVATTRFGAIHASELQRTRFLRGRLMDFLNSLVQEGQQKSFEMRRPWQPRGDLAPIGGDNDESAVMVGVVARKATDLGIVVSDSAVNQYLREVTNDMVPREKVSEIIHAFTARDLTVPQLYEGLRREVQAVRLRQLFLMGQGPGAMPPAQRWEYYQRIKQRAKVELVAIPVVDLLGEVPEPTEAEIKEFFDKYKDSLPNPYSPEPGFRVPRRVAVEYLRADFEKFKQAAESEVTEKEIADHYEANKETNYKKIKGFDDQEKKTSAEDATDKPEGDGEKPAGEEKSEDAAPAGDAPAEGKSPPADGEPGDDKKPADFEKKPGEAEKKPADAEKKDVKPDGKEPAAAPEKKPAPQSNAAPRNGRGVTASLAGFETSGKPVLQLAQAEKPAPATTKQPPAAAKQPDGKQPEAKQPEAKEPAAEAPAQPAAEAPAEAPPGEKPADDTAAKEIKEGSESTDEPAAEPEYKTLEEVKEQIRTQLAGNKARDKIKEIFDGLKAKMENYRFAQLHASEEEQKSVTRPDLEAWAAERGLSRRELPLSTYPDLADDTEFGESFSFAQFRTQRSVDLLFVRLQPFQPETAMSLSGDQFLFWKTADEKEHSTSLDEAGVRDQVIKAWKIEKAREPARKKAQALADQAMEAQKSLRELLVGQPDLVVIDTESFSWMVGSVRMPDGRSQPPTISEVVGVDKPGNEFMRAVFKLQPNETGVAMNEPKSVAYAIRLVDYEKLLPVLEREFMADSLNQYGDLATDEFREVADAWLQQIRDEAGVNWEREPDQLASNE